MSSLFLTEVEWRFTYFLHTGSSTLFNFGPKQCWSVCGCMCVCTQTHTHIACHSGVLGCEPRGLEEPVDSRLIKSRHICTRIWVPSTHVNTYAARRDEIWSKSVFVWNIFFLPKKKNKRCEHVPENSHRHGFQLHRPFIKGTRLLFKVTNAIVRSDLKKQSCKRRE